MNKAHLAAFGLVSALFVFSSITALQIDVDVGQDLNVELTSLNYDKITDRPAKISMEVYNSGSTGYNARVRVDVMQNNTLIGSLWSRGHDLTPGDRRSVDLYWYSSDAGNYSFKPRVYYGNEIFEGSTYPLEIISRQPSDVFETKNFRTYDNYIRFLVRSNETSKDTVFIPAKYTKGWIFEQARLASLDGNWTEIIIRYDPSLWMDGQKLTLLIASEDGRMLSEKQFSLALETGLQKYIDLVWDRVDAFFK